MCSGRLANTMNNKIVRLAVVLLGITAVTGIILGGIYTMTLKPIEAVQQQQKMEALSATMPGAKEFKQVEVKNDKSGLVKEINEGSDGGNVIGYNFTVAPKGYGGIITLVVGIANDGAVKGIKILSLSETPGLGMKSTEPAFSDQFKDKKADVLTVVKTTPAAAGDIQAISGATITSRAVTLGVNTALDYWRTNISGKPAPAGAAAATDATSGASEKKKKD